MHLQLGFETGEPGGAPTGLAKRNGQRRVGKGGGTTNWFRTSYENEDLWLYFEAKGEGWAARQVEVRGTDSRPVTAASLEEVLHLRDHADLTAMGRYGRQYGVLAEVVSSNDLEWWTTLG